MSDHNGQVSATPITERVQQLTQLLAPFKKEKPLPEQPKMGFFTDTSLCIGCKACEIACKQWNQLPATTPEWTGTSYDNTQSLGATTWRHVQFIEQIERRIPHVNASDEKVLKLPLFEMDTPVPQMGMDLSALPELAGTPTGTALPFFSTDRWLMRSDVCKHCANAPCQEACPTGAIIHTEFDTVYVQQDICNGCGYCVVACPFDVIARDSEGDGQAHKCTLCYDRLKDGMKPACAKACPTDSIQFGEVEQLKRDAQERLGFLQERGLTDARLYGADDKILEGGLNSFFLLLDEPETYNLPSNPARPSNHVLPTSLGVIVTAAVMGLIGTFFFKQE
ncbi:4Fe-4S dicluster domain-containing protein [Dictyobacter arantiisoli]|uniref:4Fe-4S ferredoxin n=1 Tax=Dictyobacter arantiisoli TaxID=2014874 RepID=A0A5A5TBU1_9CHLR|nr:4Fe-4S dicluster domain-containing protein [Dictyobacter arantiisoli]GCF08616.1 4Fe-4S ferredoxin [Dictyobacter arantiisoli]